MVTTQTRAGAAGAHGGTAAKGTAEAAGATGERFAERARATAPAGYRAILDPPGPVVAGQTGTWTVAVTVGGDGIQPGGGIEIVPPRRERQRWQVGHVIAWTDRPGVGLRLELTNCHPLVLHHAQYPVIRVYAEGAALQPGDTVFVRLGDRGGYVNGFRAPARAQEWTTEEANFEVAVDPEGTTRYANRNYPGPGGGAWLPLADVPTFEVLPGPPASFAVRAASIPPAASERSSDPAGGARLTVAALDARHNWVPGYGGSPQLERLRVEQDGQRWWHVVARDALAGENGVIGRSNPIAPNFGLADQGLRVFFGDLHSHCGLSGDGHRPIDFAYRFARDVTGLDFCALTDHEGGADWSATRRAAREWNDPGTFATFVGYEYSRGRRFGHRNVIYRDDDGTHPTPEDTNALWQDLPPGRALVIPHHPNTHSESGTLLGRWVWTDWAVHDDRFQRLVEIAQLRGSFEREEPDGRDVILGRRGSAAQSALALGRRVGFAGGTDNHRGMPGSRLDNMGGIDPEEFVTGGLTAVWAPELTREALFDALYARRTYATTTARILVDFRVNDAPMGSEIAQPADGRVRVRATVIGTAPLASVEIVRNNVAVYRSETRGRQALSFEWEDDLAAAPAAGEASLPDGARYYYLRLRQEDGERAWASPVWIG